MSAKGRSCATCEYAEVSMEDGELAMECRRQPPVSAPEIKLLDPPADDPELVARHAELSEDIELGVDALHRFPHVRECDWCGEWSPEHAEAER